MYAGGGTHITRDTCFPGEGTHITRDVCLPCGGTDITRDMCFLGGGTHSSKDMCFLGGEHIDCNIILFPSCSRLVSLVIHVTSDVFCRQRNTYHLGYLFFLSGIYNTALNPLSHLCILFNCKEACLVFFFLRFQIKF